MGKFGKVILIICTEVILIQAMLAAVIIFDTKTHRHTHTHTHTQYVSKVEEKVNIYPTYLGQSQPHRECEAGQMVLKRSWACLVAAVHVDGADAAHHS